MQNKLGKLFTLKHVATHVPPFKSFVIWHYKKPMDGYICEYDAKKFFCFLGYEKDEDTGWQWLKILTTSGLFGYILCYNGEELVEVTE